MYGCALRYGKQSICVNHVRIRKTLRTSEAVSMTFPETGHELYDVDEDIRDIEHPIFKVKYRLESSSAADLAVPADSKKLPVIKVLGTGGTIASKGFTASQTAGYHVDLTIERLISSIPDLSRTCELQFEQVFNLDSKEISTKQLLELKDRTQVALNEYDGVVITHGTDSCEETAFFLASTLTTYAKPVVMCGSMRPSTSVSADGPSNLYQACMVAADKQSRGRGILITLNDKIGSGYYITKSDANSLDTFKSLGQGYLGNFVNNEVHYYYPPARPTGLVRFNQSIIKESLPEVVILYAHQGFNNELLKLTIEQLKVQGLVMATMGAGSLPDDTNELLGKLAAEYEIPVVYSKRSMDGMVPRGGMPSKNSSHLIASGYLNPQKTRILLQLCLNDEMCIEDIRRVFRGVYGG